MSQSFLNGKITLHGGDNREVLKGFADNSIDSVVTDPPYALVSIGKRFGKDGSAPIEQKEGAAGAYARASRGFMGKQWDTGETAFAVEFWAEIFRVLKPGGHVVSFSGTRTYHRMAVAIEDAGFEIRDMCQWLYGSGFPKSHNISKGIDRALGVENEREITHYNKQGPRSMFDGGKPRPASLPASLWDGWGTALKPAVEPICLARKPLSEKTIVANVLKHGTGALNIDGTRIGTRTESTGEVISENSSMSGQNYGRVETDEQTIGRWPANVLHDGSEEVLAGFPLSQSTRAEVTSKAGAIYGNGSGLPSHTGLYGFDDSGSAARFFKDVKFDENELLLCRAKAKIKEWNSALANTADNSTHLSSEAVASALSDAVIWAYRVTMKSFKGHFTAVTPTELKRLCESAIMAMMILEHVFLPESRLEKPFLNGCHAEIVETLGQIDTMTIILSHWRLDGSADPVTFDITQTKKEVGEAAFASRMWYSSKADSEDRSGSKHPTVKPVGLMQWLCRLITPPGGTILDPFAGSGSTGEAAWREGFNCVLIEREAEYLVDIARRLEMADQGPVTRANSRIVASGKVQTVDDLPMFGGGAVQ